MRIFRIGLLVIAALLLLSAASFAQCNATTANIGLNIPPNGCFSGTWDTPYNANWNAIDSYLSGGSVSPLFKANNLWVTGLTVGRCVQVGTGGQLQVASAACNPVTSFNGRAGAISPTTGDYTIGQIGGITFMGTLTSNLATFGTVTGATGALFCKDANANLTTIGCSSGAGGSVLLAPAGDQSIVTPSGHMLSTNVLEQWVFADNYAPTSSGGINEAFAACGNSGHCVVWAGIGTITACNITVPSSSTLRGHGRTTTVLQCGTTSAPVIADVGSNSVIENFTVQHSSNPTTNGDGVLTSGDRVIIRNVKAVNNQIGFRLGGVTNGETYSLISEQNNSDCLLFDTTLGTTTMQWFIHGGLYQKCGGWGMNMVNTTSTKWTGPRILDGFALFANHAGGMKFSNTSTGRIDNIFIQDGVFSQNDGDNIQFDANGHNWTVQGNYIEQAGGNVATGVQPLWGFNAASGTGTPSGTGDGIDITSNCDAAGIPPLISGNRFFQNSDDSIMSQCAGTTVVGNGIYDSGFNHSSGAANLRAGISIQASQMQVNDNFCQQGGSHSLSCIDISNSADKPSMLGNSCGTNYTDSTCYTETTFPTNGIRTWVGNTLFIQSLSSPSLSAGQCSGINGSFWQRVDATGGLWYCVNGQWTAK